MYLINMGKKKICNLGRCNKNDIIIKEISVTRFHATIKFIDKSNYFIIGFYLLDN
ncbi:MAG: FHA domain-containing protein [bacterium]|jgi:hypothetical protein